MLTRLRSWRFLPLAIVLLILGFGVLVAIIAHRWVTRPRYAEVLMKQVVSDAVFPPGDYYDVAWIDASRLALLYVPPDVSIPARLPHLWDLKLIVYDFITGQLSADLLSTPAACYAAGPTLVERLPNNMLGFLYQCNSEDSTKDGTTLYQWDPERRHLTILQFYASPFVRAPFSFSPDMSELLQENAIGNGLNNELYHVTATGMRSRLFPIWQRVTDPSWSPDGQTIAFVATESQPKGEPQSFSDIIAVAEHDWDLYFMDGDQDNLRTMLSNVRISRLRWLPSSQHLAFRGDYRGASGIWVLNTLDQKVTRIWPAAYDYDFSPDGTQAVILQRFDVDGDTLYRPVIVAVPPELYATPAP